MVATARSQGRQGASGGGWQRLRPLPRRAACWCCRSGMRHGSHPRSCATAVCHRVSRRITREGWREHGSVGRGGTCARAGIASFWLFPVLLCRVSSTAETTSEPVPVASSLLPKCRAVRRLEAKAAQSSSSAALRAAASSSAASSARRRRSISSSILRCFSSASRCCFMSRNAVDNSRSIFSFACGSSPWRSSARTRSAFADAL